MKRILLIEDEPHMLESLKTYLVAMGYDTRTAENGEIGMQMFREEPTDLVITDLLMPIKDGASVIMDLNAEFPETKIIVITGGVRFDGVTLQEKLESLKVDSVLTKPFSLRDLLRHVKPLID
jgi:DNA-binding response OmpR family regulator